jgi:hypothetical protein
VRAEAQRVQADEEDVLLFKTALLQRGDKGAHEAERRGQAGAGISVDLEADLFLRPGHETTARGGLVVLQRLLHGVAVIRVAEIGQLVLPDRRGRRHRLGCASGNTGQAQEKAAEDGFLQVRKHGR